MISRIILGLLGALYLVNGLWTVADPTAWYAGVPGVSLTGPMNEHFIQDIGFASVASGLLMLLSLRKGFAILGLGGALWPALHALIHLGGWLEHGLPSDARIFFTEGVGVIAFAVLGLWAGAAYARMEGAV